MKCSKNKYRICLELRILLPTENAISGHWISVQVSADWWKINLKKKKWEKKILFNDQTNGFIINIQTMWEIT